MERKKLESAAASYYYLRGLFGIPLGLLPVIAALGNWEWGPFRHAWFFIAAVLALAAACLPINRFYNEHYGRVTPSTRQQVRTVIVLIVVAPLSVGLSLLLRSRADWSLDLPVNATATSFALLMLAGYAAYTVLRPHHLIIFGSLLVAGLLPVWNGADPSNIGLALAGVAIMATGLFDHRVLVRTFGPAKALKLGNSNAGA
jgi:hypothetical protein